MIMSTQNQNRYTGPNAKNYNKLDKQASMEQAESYATGLSARERANLTSMNYEDSVIIDQERQRLKRIEELKRKKKKLKLRPRAVALLAAVGLIASHSIGSRVVKGFQKNHAEKFKHSEEVDINSTRSSSMDENAHVDDGKDDKITYVVDFNEYANPDAEITIRELIDSGKVGALILKAGGTGYDYPFAIKNFDEEEIENEMSPYVGEVVLSGNMGKMKDMEKYINMAMDKDLSVGFYYYTGANTYREADIEAAYMKSFYNKLEKDMPQIKDAKLMPVTIDIEDAGPEREGKNLSDEQVESIKERRTDAVRHLVADLAKNGVVDQKKGVIIYGDINRVAEHTHVNWENLYDGIEKDGTKVIQWGTRALPQTFDNAITYTNTASMMGDLMNDEVNINYMKDAYKSKQEQLKEVAIMQIHLDEEITNGANWSQLYDISQTTEKTLDAIVNGEEIDYGDGFVYKIENIHNEAKNKSIEYPMMDVSDTADELDR